jgi:hypothetical protein
MDRLGERSKKNEPVEPFSFAAESFEYVDCLVF